MRNRLKSLGLASIITVGLAGCDNKRDVLLDEAEVKGPVKIKLIQEVKRGGSDGYRLEVYDEKEKLRLRLPIFNLQEGTMLVHDDGKIYTVEDGKRGYIISK